MSFRGNRWPYRLTTGPNRPISVPAIAFGQEALVKYAIPSVFLVLAALLAVPVAGLGQTIIENPAVPAACDSGRVRELAEVWRITDEGGQFSLKYPDGFQI